MYDAVFVGSGHNNLAAAIVLAKAGWKVAVFEQAEDVGGAVRTVESTLPGFRHDALSNMHILIHLSPFYREFREDLRRHGLTYLSYPVISASVFRDGDAVAAHPDLERTLQSLGRQSAADAAGWRRLFDLYRHWREALAAVLSSPIPSPAALTALAGPRLRLGPKGNMEFVQMLTLPAKTLAESYFESDKAKAWFVSWAMNVTPSPETAGGGVFGLLLLGAAQDPEGGLTIPRGGSGALAQAMASLLRALGGEVHTRTRVDRIIVRGRAAEGVGLADGAEVRAGRAVVAGTAPTKLFFDLVGAEHLPSEFVARVGRYRYGPPLLRIDYALSRLPPWTAGEEPAGAGIVRPCAGVGPMSEASSQVLRGYLPEEPVFFVSQATVADPTRAPAGKHTLWAAAKVPYQVEGDAAGKIQARPWVHVKERLADRVTDLIERHAPGFKEAILARTVMSPEDLEDINPNLVHGDAGCGSVEFHQLFFFRPVPGWSRYDTPVRRLYLCGAATHPGPGVHAMSGWALGRILAG